MSFNAWLDAHEGQLVTAEVADWMDRFTRRGVLSPAGSHIQLLQEDGSTELWWIGHTFAVRCANGDEAVCALADQFTVDYDDSFQPVMHDAFCAVHDRPSWRIWSCGPAVRKQDGWRAYRFLPHHECACGREAAAGLQWFDQDGVWARTEVKCRRCARRGKLGPKVVPRIRVGSRVRLTAVPKGSMSQVVWPFLVVGAEGVVTWTLYGPGDLWASIRVQFDEGEELTLDTAEGFKFTRIESKGRSTR